MLADDLDDRFLMFVGAGSLVEADVIDSVDGLTIVHAMPVRPKCLV